MKFVLFFILLSFSIAIVSCKKVRNIKHADDERWWENAPKGSYWWDGKNLGGECSSHCVEQKNVVCQLKKADGTLLEEYCCSKHGCLSLKVLGKDHPELALSEWEAEGVNWDDFDHESSVCPEYEPIELRHQGDDATYYKKNLDLVGLIIEKFREIKLKAFNMK